MSVNGLTKVEVPKKLLCFSAHGVSIFQGVQNGVAVQNRKCYAPFFIGIHCKSNYLIVQTLFHLPMVTRLKYLLHSFFFFCKFPKRHSEFVKLAQIMETKGKKLLCNIKIKWINMLKSTARCC